MRVVEENVQKHGADPHGFVLSGGSITKTRCTARPSWEFYEEYIRAIKEVR